jgi:hypothetical protein
MNQKLKGFTGAAAAAFPKFGTEARASAPRTKFRECGEVAIAPVQHPLSGEDSSGGAAAPRLEKRTYSNTYSTARNRITLRNYGKGLAEVGWSFVGLSSTHKAARGSST